jgi:hypothetical protein
MATGAEIEQLTEQINKVSESLEKLSNQSQVVVVHRSEGPTPLLAAGIAVMICTLFMLLLFAAWVIPILHDLQAWRDIHQAHISAIEAQLKGNQK